MPLPMWVFWQKQIRNSVLALRRQRSVAVMGKRKAAHPVRGERLDAIGQFL